MIFYCRLLIIHIHQSSPHRYKFVIAFRLVHQLIKLVPSILYKETDQLNLTCKSTPLGRMTSKWDSARSSSKYFKRNAFARICSTWWPCFAHQKAILAEVSLKVCQGFAEFHFKIPPSLRLNRTSNSFSLCFAVPEKRYSNSYTNWWAATSSCKCNWIDSSYLKCFQ